MSGPFGSSQWMYSSGGFYPKTIGQSLRFNDDDSAYLSRTPASAGNRKTWTWSGWVKRGNLGSAQTLLGANTTFVEFTSADKIQFDHNGTTVATSAVFRDPSAWYHVVVAVDTTQATAADRTEIYVNGTIQAVTGSYVSQNTDTDVNNATQHNIGANLTPAEYFDGYMAEVNFIDGQALDPTSFGEFKSGVWVPKAYTGTYGTNGFYLPFSDSAAIGDDLSGNGNDWTPSGLAATDVLLDSPTNNYAVWNPLGGTALTFSDGNLRAVSPSTSSLGCFGSFPLPSSGKWYFEAKLTSNSGSSNIANFGVAPRSTSLSGNQANAANSAAFYMGSTVILQVGVGTTVRASAGLTSDVFQVCYDADTRDVYLGINNTFYSSAGAATGDPAAGTNPSRTLAAGDFAPWMFGYQNGWIVNHGQSPFAYTPPADFLPLNTRNLPDPVIDPAVDDVPADYFDVVLDTGANIKTASEALFTNQLAAIKDRANVNNWQWIDSPRGLSAVLQSNTTAAETTYAAPSGNSAAFVWRASDAAPVSNTDGTITSTVSVNQKAGFSIVSWTGVGSAANTIGHGLGSPAKMIITKTRTASVTYNWNIYHVGLDTTAPEDYFIALNTTAARGSYTTADLWNRTQPTASVFSVNSQASAGPSGDEMIAYCFAEVEGYSKFGSYTGNGSADGPFCWNGFKPAFIMVKRTDSTSNWTILDNVREGYNVDNDPLYPNLSNAEGTADLADLLSNGFKLRTTDASVNASGGTYIFAAFSEMPFKFSNAR